MPRRFGIATQTLANAGVKYHHFTRALAAIRMAPTAASYILGNAFVSSNLQAKDYHRTPIRLLNHVLRGVGKLGIATFDMSVDTLLASARAETGLSDFGDERFMQPLSVLVQATNEEAKLNPVGRYLARTNILRLLKGRLFVEDLLARHPEILEREIPDPVVIVGLARSGTTRLHRLLAADERFLHLKSWESVYPVPYPECFSARDEDKTDPRITALEQGLKAVLYMGPQISAVHPLGTFEVEEEIGLLQHAFATQLFEIQAQIPTFAEHLMSTPQDAAYEYMVRLMKIVSWFRNDPPDTPWLLKSPQHMQDLDALLHVFPGAKILCPHRDPVKVVGSTCSMAWNAIVRDNDSVTPQWVGNEWFEKTERMLRKTLEVRAGMAQEQQYDLLYADITADWEQSMQGVYDFLQIPFSAQARQGMQQWLNENQQHKHGSHKYNLTDFGLSAEQVELKLAFYREKFNIPFETSNPHKGANSPPSNQ